MAQQNREPIMGAIKNHFITIGSFSINMILTITKRKARQTKTFFLLIKLRICAIAKYPSIKKTE
jgi:hypothetical protein